MGFFGRLKNAVIHPKESAERAVRRRVIAAAITALLGLATAAGWNVSPEFREAIITAVDAIATAIEERPAPPADQAPETPDTPQEVPHGSIRIKPADRGSGVAARVFAFADCRAGLASARS
jgi:hypothetical protein